MSLPQPLLHTHICRGLNGNLAIAKEAIKYVKGNMPLGASNNGTEAVKSWFSGIALSETGECVLSLKEDRDEWKSKKHRSTFDIIRWTADRALRSGCGNCDEHAMAVYWHLTQHRHDVCPVDLMSIPNEHVFVVIGREKDENVNEPGKWGVDAVICDAWDDQAGPANHMFDTWKFFNRFEAGRKPIRRWHRTQ
ncbi:hypothetical protein [Vannielia litorea]|uniref:hypothetical protein n=1 Tax=Vannielia litorea TaxID=1217970 RepID=UPI001BCC06E0|nr:hypothetical protein [Vannielia litorea]MBS8228067.1 hypothetical protein [Vannielia litorea]